MLDRCFRPRRPGQRQPRRFRPCRLEVLEPRTPLAADVLTGLVHHWKFDETSGDVAADSAGGSPGTLVNWIAGQPKWEPGRVGGALRFSSSGSYVIAQPPPFAGSFSIAFWLNAETRLGPYARIFTAKAGNVVHVAHEVGRGVSYTQNNDFFTFSPDPPTFNHWEHYVVNFNSATGQGVIYRNGAPVAIGAFADSASLPAWVLGHHSDLSNHAHSLHGALDDFRVYDRVLQDDDIALLASLGTPAPTHQEPVHHWTFDETTGFTAHDIAGGADGVLLNWNQTEPRWEAGQVGGALRFSTADNAVVTSSVSTGAQWSVAWWLNVTTRTGINPRVIDPWAYLNLENNRGVGFTSRNQHTFDPAPVSLNRWEHYVVTYDTIQDVGTIYRNGVAVKSGYFADNAPASALIFGHQNDLGNHNDSLNGLLDDLRIYDRLLSPSEIALLAEVPVAVNDAYSMNEDAALNVNVDGGVLTNDSDSQGGPLTASLVAGPAQGALALNSEGGFTYAPPANFFGTVSFTYRAHSASAASGLATVTISVAPVNDPPSFTKGPNQAATDESGPQTVTNWATALSAGPPNEAGQGLAFVVTTDNLSLFADRPIVQADGRLNYTPAPNASGVATVTVVLRDGAGTASGGVNASPPQQFQIQITKPHPWRNINNPRDVDGNAVIAPLDAVLVINYLNAGRGGPIPSTVTIGPPYLDVVANDSIGPADAIEVINALNSAGTLFGPLPYRSAADSPLGLTGLGNSSWLEDFEDGLLNTPGVSAINGFVRNPGSLTDSVDADDGAIDNQGSAGHSYLVRPGSLGVTFVFDALALGGLPQSVGVVITGGGPKNRIEFYNAADILVAVLASPIEESGLSSTDGDRFLGIFHSTGIRRIRLINDGVGNQGLELDHLQYGNLVPAHL